MIRFQVPTATMSRNVEIKASVADLNVLLKRASELCDLDYPWRNKGKRIAQRDIFFHSTNGRMKLRRLETEVSPHSPNIFTVGKRCQLFDTVPPCPQRMTYRKRTEPKLNLRSILVDPFFVNLSTNRFPVSKLHSPSFYRTLNLRPSRRPKPRS